MLNKLILELKSKSSEEKSQKVKRFFKTGKGEYSQKDIFLGLTMPEQREIVKKYYSLSFSQIQKLLNSPVHEYRMVGGLILISKFKKYPEETFNFYIKNAKKFNNWDLVDITCTGIIGEFLKDKNKKILHEFSNSKNLWEKRISIVSTLVFVRNSNFGDALKIAENLLEDKHDLIHKAVGWVLREIGKKNEKVLKDFLKIHYTKLPRTTLRYAIEKFNREERTFWLKGEF